MFDEYIKRSDAQDKIKLLNKVGGCAAYDCDDVENAIKNIPAVDVVEVVHGEWLPTVYNVRNMKCDIVGTALPQYLCSRCGREEREKEPYCNCGAKMDGKNIN